MIQAGHTLASPTKNRVLHSMFPEINATLIQRIAVTLKDNCCLTNAAQIHFEEDFVITTQRKNVKTTPHKQRL